MEFKLIIKKLNNTLSVEEEIIFLKWYNESTSHKDYFNSVKKNYKTDIDYIDIEKGWLRLQNSLKARKQKSHYWKYAVAGSVALLITITFLLNKEDNPQINTPIIVNNTIETGTDKATLTLEDGSEVPLEKGMTYQTDNINSNGEELIYDSKNESRNEIVYNYLTIPRGGQFFVQLSDGTQVWLNSESQLKYPVTFLPGMTRQVELVYGEAYFDVSPSTENQDSKFKVLNRNQEVEVLGTEFNIKAYKEENVIYTTLVEGEVVISNLDSKQSLVPNQQSRIHIDTKEISINEVDVYSETSWRKGFFSFKSKTLKEIMIVLSRWYDVQVEFEKVELEKVKFNGVLSKRNTIDEILTSIQNTNFINAYEIKDKTITIK
ncbi:FecR family protein [Flagellimonas eckloniae]|uniref:Anti-sigma factor n=1 Tax=Flagellimonas eckloniae TaxID=346185 RepID=A0A0Q1BVZ0_9FLAO|nr:FecR domain-containing protein [Allomuricauda eckloniae]KQC28686.1 anti-sigma factor [Allomuricauda eckloniae]